MYRHSKFITLRSAAIATLMAQAALAHSQATFTPIGFLSNQVGAYSTGQISYNGKYVAGVSNDRGFVWTPEGGMVALGLLDGIARHQVKGVANDGTVFGSTYYSNSSGTYREPAYWAPEGGAWVIHILPHVSLNGWVDSIAPDGTAGGMDGSKLVLWTKSGGSYLESTLGTSSTYDYRVFAVADNGVVATMTNTDRTVDYQMIPATGQRTVLPGFGYGAWAWCNQPDAITPDGQTIYGHYTAFGGYRACRWTAARGIECFGVPPGFIHSAAGLGSSDGNVVGGAAWAPGRPPTDGRATLWTPSLGMVELQPYLVSQGALSAGTWQNLNYGFVSSDGTHIAGTGHDANGNQQAFYATIAPQPGAPAVHVASLAFSPLHRVAGNPVNVVATLDAPAPPGGAKILIDNLQPTTLRLNTSKVLFGGQSGIFIPEGATVGVLPGNALGYSATRMEIQSRYAGIIKYAQDTLTRPALYNPSLTANTVAAGASLTVNLKLNGDPDPGMTFLISSNHPEAADIPASVQFPTGVRTAGVTLTAKSVADATQVTIHIYDQANPRSGKYVVVTVTPS